MKLLKTIKYKGKFYKRGQRVKIDDKDVKEFIDRGIIEEKEENENTGDFGPLNAIEPEVDYSMFTVASLKQILDEKGIEYKRDARKDELVALLEG